MNKLAGTNPVPMPPPLAPKAIRTPPTLPTSVPPPLSPSPIQKEDQSQKSNDINKSLPEGFDSSLDPSTLKDRFFQFMNGPREHLVTKEQAKLDKLEMMLLNLNTAIHAKLSQPQASSAASSGPSQAQLQQLMTNSNGGALNSQYRTQPGLETPQFKSVKKRKAESQLTIDETEELLKRRVNEDEIKFRDGGGKPVAYIDNYTANKNAVEVLGFDGWSDLIISSSVLVATVEGDKFSYEVVVLMRMYLENGSFREDFGFGKSTRSSKGESLAMALKAAATMARKRLWKLCGEYMGNSLYDKNYVEEVSKRRKNWTSAKK
jgi:DNA recombination protein Rad52